MVGCYWGKLGCEIGIALQYENLFKFSLKKLSKEYGKPVLAFSGCVTKNASACNAAGIDAFFPILRSVVSLEEAMDVKNAAENMTDTVEQAFRLFLLQ